MSIKPARTHPARDFEPDAVPAPANTAGPWLTEAEPDFAKKLTEAKPSPTSGLDAECREVIENCRRSLQAVQKAERFEELAETYCAAGAEKELVEARAQCRVWEEEAASANVEWEELKERDTEPVGRTVTLLLAEHEALLTEHRNTLARAAHLQHRLDGHDSHTREDSLPRPTRRPKQPASFATAVSRSIGRGLAQLGSHVNRRHDIDTPRTQAADNDIAKGENR